MEASGEDVSDHRPSVHCPDDEPGSSSLSSALALGSSVQVTLGGICEPSPVLLKLITSRGDDKAALTVRAQLLPGGASAHVAIASSAITLRATHCTSGSSCVQFQAVGRPVVLRVALSPSVFDALRRDTDALRLEVEIRSQRSRELSLAFCVGLAYLVHGVAQVPRMPAQFKLLAKRDGSVGGIVHADVGLTGGVGKERALEPLASTLQPLSVQHQQTAPINVSAHVREIKLTTLSVRSIAHAAVRIWSSSGGRQRASTTPPMAWDYTAGSFRVEQEAAERPTAWFEVACLQYEVFFVEVCRFSQYERNDVLGRCSFSISQCDSQGPSLYEARVKLALATTDTTPQKTTPQCFIGLASGVFGEIVVSLSVRQYVGPHDTLSGFPDDRPATLQAAASVLSDAAFVSSETVESRGILEVELLSAYPPLNDCVFAGGERAQVRLRVLSAHWRGESQVQEVKAVSSSGEQQVSWNEPFSASVEWSLKHRQVPELQLDLTAIRRATWPRKTGGRALVTAKQQQLKRSPPNLQPMCKLRHSAQRKPCESPADVETERLVGTCTLSLCAFFAHPSAITTTYVVLAAVDYRVASRTTKNDDGRIECTTVHSESLRFIPIVLRIRLASPSLPAQDTGQKRSSLTAVRAASVIGNVCVHIRTSSGGFSQRGDRNDQFFVSVSFGTRSVRSRCVVRVITAVCVIPRRRDGLTSFPHSLLGFQVGWTAEWSACLERASGAPGTVRRGSSG